MESNIKIKNINDVYLMGRPTDKWKIRDTGKGKPYVRFTLAMTNGSKTEFIPCIYSGDDLEELSGKITTKTCLLLHGAVATNSSEYLPPLEIRVFGIELADEGNIYVPLNRFFISCSPAGEAEMKKTRDGADYVRVRVCCQGYRRSYLTVISFKEDVIRRIAGWSDKAQLLALEGRITSVKDDDCPEINLAAEHVYACVTKEKKEE